MINKKSLLGVVKDELWIRAQIVLVLTLLFVGLSCDKNPVISGPTPDDPVTDIDGNVYQTIRIGSQIWTVENLRTTKYNDGSAIPLVTDNAAWAALTTPGYCYYNNTTNTDSIKKWGALYNWYVVNPVNPQKIAPAGWHVPTDADWTILEKYLIASGYNWDGTTDTTAENKIAKSLASKTDWYSATNAGAIGNDLTKNNGSGFSALPGGFRVIGGSFVGQSLGGCWLSATEFGATLAWYRHIHFGFGSLFRLNYDKGCGLSVRLLRDLN